MTEHYKHFSLSANAGVHCLRVEGFFQQTIPQARDFDRFCEYLTQWKFLRWVDGWAEFAPRGGPAGAASLALEQFGAWLVKAAQQGEV